MPPGASDKAYHVINFPTLEAHCREGQLHVFSADVTPGLNESPACKP